MTKESFTEAVNKDFSELMKSHDSERIEAYLAGDEAPKYHKRCLSKWLG